MKTSKAYRCIELGTSGVIVSRDVVFDKKPSLTAIPLSNREEGIEKTSPLIVGKEAQAK